MFLVGSGREHPQRRTPRREGWRATAGSVWLGDEQQQASLLEGVEG